MDPDSDLFEALSSEDEALDEALLSKPPRRKKNAVFEKDSDEEDLEKLVFGDKHRFRQQLLLDDLLGYGVERDDDASALQQQIVESGGDADDAGDADDTGLDHVNDADLYIIDPTPAHDSFLQNADGDADANAIVNNTHANAHAHAQQIVDTPAWEDSDDEKLTVSLATVSRLWKLRVAEGEDAVSGAEYSRRLRQHFLKLNPLPQWAKRTTTTERAAKRRRRRRHQHQHSASPASSAGSDAAETDSNDDDDDDDDDDDNYATQPLAKFLRDANGLATMATTIGGSSTKPRLRPETIDIQRTRDVPVTHKGHVTSLSFHPTQPILLSSSPASLLYLHRIDADAHPTPNPELLSVHPKQVDVRRSEFAGPRGDRVFFAGRRSYIHKWDLDTGLVQKTSQVLGHKREHKTMERFRVSPCGRWIAMQASARKGGGQLNVLNAASMQWVGSARLDGRHGIADFAWWGDGGGLSILAKDGSVGEWGLASKTFHAVWHDQGCIGGIVISLGGSNGPADAGGNRWVAVGSSSGIVNLYDRRGLFADMAGATATATAKAHPTPTRVFDGLITPITTITFSPDGQLMAFGSQWKKDALRLAHLPSCTVYRNWPTQQTPLGRITAVAFGRHAPLLAVGNDVGKVRLWEIR